MNTDITALGIGPILSIITNIAYDHTALLGNTLQEIAMEKAGMIKDNIPVVIGETQLETKDVFGNKAREKHSHISFADTHYKVILTDSSRFEIQDKDTGKTFCMDMTLTGDYQCKNVVTALVATDYLSEFFDIPVNTLRHGIEKANILGKWQKIGDNPLTICDTGHNPAGITYVTA